MNLSRRRFLTGASATAAAVVIAANVPKAAVQLGAYLDEQPAWVPKGWLLPDGRALLRTRYPELFEVMGSTYGGGPLTFNLPDFQRYASGTVKILIAAENDGFAPAGMVTNYFHEEVQT